MNDRSKDIVLLMPLAESIKEFVSFILKGVDLIDHNRPEHLKSFSHQSIPRTEISQ